MKKIIFASAFGLAILGAFATRANNNNLVVNGYQKVGTTCTNAISVSCSPSPTQTCTVSGISRFQSDCSFLAQD
jgi:hypothetical protein